MVTVTLSGVSTGVPIEEVHSCVAAIAKPRQACEATR